MDQERRIKKLENAVQQQGYVIRILLTLMPFSVAGMLVLWNTQGTPDYDHIGVSMTVFQTLFGIAALYGFWALRALTKEKAEEVAELEVRKIAHPIIRRIADEAMQAYSADAPISDKKVAGMMDKLDGTEGADGK